MANKPLPTEFPGDFFVLTWDRDAEVFVLELDDEDNSSFEVGHEPWAVVTLLRLRGYAKDLRELAVDYAREFGCAQVIPDQNRVIQHPPRPKQSASLDWSGEKQDSHDWIPSL